MKPHLQLNPDPQLYPLALLPSTAFHNHHHPKMQCCLSRRNHRHHHSASPPSLSERSLRVPQCLHLTFHSRNMSFRNPHPLKAAEVLGRLPLPVPLRQLKTSLDLRRLHPPKLDALPTIPILMEHLAISTAMISLPILHHHLLKNAQTMITHHLSTNRISNLQIFFFGRSRCLAPNSTDSAISFTIMCVVPIAVH